ncbi:DUF3278 domain-containing protein [Leuconostoc fallax]|uniref:DUF3278 domain-containing protein n=1 Tax=Leuconostoc fallax TaxID=1251 RepID=UPI0009D6A2CF
MNKNDKKAYDISGPLDEYKRSEINRIGNNAFMMLWIYSSFASFCTLLVISLTNIDAYDILLGLLLSNLIFSIDIIGGYVIYATRKAKLSEIDVTVDNYPKQKRLLKKKSALQGIYWGMSMFLIMGVISPNFSSLFSWISFFIWLSSGALFGLIMYWYHASNLKN